MSTGLIDNYLILLHQKIKFGTYIQKRSSLHHHFRRCRRRHHMDGLISHVNPTNNSE